MGLVMAVMLAHNLQTASATPSAVAPQVPATSLEMKQAERDAALRELEDLRVDLRNKIAQYITLGRNIESVRLELNEVGADIVETDYALARSEAAVRDRAVALYRSDRTSMLEILLGSESVPDLLSRASYLLRVSEYDRRIITELRRVRSESEWLHGYLNSRVERLTGLQQAADTQREAIEAAMAAQEAKATLLGKDIADLMRLQQAISVAGSSGAKAPKDEYTPDMLITDANFTAGDSMSAAQIQAFLEQQPGRLATYRAVDHAGQEKSAAEIIADAAVAWNVSPTVILVTLQKEQSLLAKKSPSQKSLDWAMGCGKADSKTYYEYQGFGKQIWYGAYKLQKNAGPWYAGIEMTIDGSAVRPVNSSTYSLYKYTPHLRGTMSFWMLYWRYFGDPTG